MSGPPPSRPAAKAVGRAGLPGRDRERTALREHWGIAYIVNAGDDAADELWTAERRDNGDVLSACSAGELSTAIRRDYGDRPVPRPDT